MGPAKQNFSVEVINSSPKDIKISDIFYFSLFPAVI